MEQTVTSKYFTRSSSNANHLRRRFLKIEENTNQIYSKKIKVEQTTSALEQKPTWYPENWELLLKNIKDMRGDRTAVVDSQGCERTADPKETPRVRIKIYNKVEFVNIPQDFEYKVLNPLWLSLCHKHHNFYRLIHKNTIVSLS